jgi:DNA-binding response OmpR family regulator
MLQAAGYAVETTANANQAIDLVPDYKPDLIVLDIVFKGQSLDGIDVCKVIRQDGCPAPIVLITAYMTETEHVLRGFEAGADDYVTRSKDNREIMAHIRANLPPEVLLVDNHILADFAGRRIWVCLDGRWQRVRLPRKEYELLQTLITNAGRIMPTTTLKSRVWDKPPADGALAVRIFGLRQKLEPDPNDPVYIKIEPGIGYHFDGRPTRASLTTLEYGCGSVEEDAFNE